MRSCKRLKNINSVSGKLGERQFDPLRTFAGVGYRAVQIAVRLSKFECSRDYLVAERDVHRQKW
jgi:hypothetical protein